MKNSKKNLLQLTEKEFQQIINRNWNHMLLEKVQTICWKFLTFSTLLLFIFRSQKLEFNNKNPYTS